MSSEQNDNLDTLYPTLTRLADLKGETVGYQQPDLIREAVSCYWRLAASEDALEEAELAQRNAEAKYEACKLQAQCWSHEAKAQKATVLESYQAASGATGEPGDWNGAEPIRRLVERAEAAELAQREATTAAIANYECVERWHKRALAAEALCADLRADAERWQESLRIGFPVRNQTARHARLSWTINGDHYGETPNAAIDAARGAK